MGVDLTLAFSAWRSDTDQPLLYCRLPLRCRDYELWERIQTRALPATSPVDWYGDEGVISTMKDPYGDPLTYLPAGVLGTILPSGAETDEYEAFDIAVFVFIQSLPPEHPVYLWWH